MCMNSNASFISMFIYIRYLWFIPIGEVSSEEGGELYCGSPLIYNDLRQCRRKCRRGQDLRRQNFAVVENEI